VKLTSYQLLSGVGMHVFLVAWKPSHAIARARFACFVTPPANPNPNPNSQSETKKAEDQKTEGYRRRAGRAERMH
jgi:hypothetical protein